MNEPRPDLPTAHADASACVGMCGALGARMLGVIGELEALGVPGGDKGAAMTGAAAPGGRAGEAMAESSGADAVAALVLWERLGRMVDSGRVAAAGAVNELCAAELGDERLSVRNGFSSPAKFVASLTGTWVSTAMERIRLAARIRSQVSLVGLTLPARFPAVQKALAEGRLGIDTAEVITRTLTDAASTIGYTDDLAAAEELLVEAAAHTAGGLGFTANQITDLAVNLRDRLDPDGAEPRTENLCQKRSMTFLRLPSGMTKLIALLPPEDAATWFAIDAATQSPRVRPMFASDSALPADSVDGTGAASPADDPVNAIFADPRTPGQRRVDTFTDLIRKAATLPEVPRINGVAATVAVHADLDDIIEGRGLGWIPGISEPLPASSVQQLLCHADIRTTVFGAAGEVLCQGKKQRLFTTHQFRAMAARDGGCVWPGCDRPPSWCESHHVTPWTSPEHAPGRTDIDNGALLCHFHHGIVHTADWTLTMIGGVPHFLPPAGLDWRRTPHPATRQRTRTRLRPLTLEKLGGLRDEREPWQRDTTNRQRP